MAQLRLPAGTDVAEMALLDVDALPQSRSLDSEELDALVAQHRLIRLPTGADGSYLLHLYLDESPPDQVAGYCHTEDTLNGHFSSKEGRIAFGGVESAFQNFKPNRFIRCDAVIPAGSYTYTAYHTDIPDEVVVEAIRSASTPKDLWLDRTLPIILLLTLGLTYILAIRMGVIVAAPVLVLGFLLFKAVKRLPAYKALTARREAAQLEFPSMVIEMRPNPTH